MFEIAANLRAGEVAAVAGDDLVMIFSGRAVWLTADKTFPSWEKCRGFLPPDIKFFMVGSLNGRRCFAAELSRFPEAGNFLQEYPVRQFLFEFPDDGKMALCRAKNLLSWRRQHRYCGACRADLQPSDHDSGLICPECGAVYYPQLSPAVIVAITRNEGKELLLAHNRNFAGNMYSLIAGFVESGECVEDAVRREILEECGITVGNISYLSSQMWPFPNSLMLAFHAEYASGEAVADGVELSDLGWFTRTNHPELPSPGSIARKVIDQLLV